MKRISETAFRNLCNVLPGKPAEPSEKSIQAAVIDLLLLRGAEIVRVNGGAVKTEKGFVRFNIVGKGKRCSDVVACYRGLFLAVECKRPGEDPTEKQQAFLDAVDRAGGIGIVARCVEDMAAVLDGVDAERGGAGT